ncbi:MAG: ATP-binding protein [Candidatus Nanohalarchaeota archaeon]|nr:MAG: ATP-binding protein [Candidatus Nanohaloarchaeota archaeon]
MKEVLEQYNPWWFDTYDFSAIQRPKYLDKIIEDIDRKNVIIITGIRRVGKTTLIKQTITELLKKVPAKKVFYASLDNFEFENHTIKDIIETYREMKKIPIDDKAYLFLDEVTYKKNFQQEIKNLYDMTNLKIIISSSSASVLKDKKAFLTGRTKTIEVMPLDFQEFLQFRKIKVKKYDYALMKTYFDDYLKNGGMPEYVLEPDIDYLKELVESIVYKDIIAYHNIKDKTIVFNLLKLLSERVGKRLTYNKLANILKISVDSVRRYLSYFEDTYLVYMIGKHGSLNERMAAPRKVYFSDTGIRNVLAGFKDTGSLFENIVFLRIKDKNPMYYMKDSVELDFVFGRNIIECKYTDDKNKKQDDLLDELSSMYNVKIIGFKEFVMDKYHLAR